ncbi:Protein SLOW WALKER 1 [Bienertia sinuspersici]
MAAELETFPTNPRLKPTSKKPNKSPESKYWKSFKTKEISGLISSVTSIDFSPKSPHHFAATHSASLSFFNPHHPFTPHEPISKTHSFKDLSFSASFRSDGKLIAAGSQSGVIHVFEAKTRNQLRQLKGHHRPVRCGSASPVDDNLFVTGSYDHTIRVWDIRGGIGSNNNSNSNNNSAMLINHGKPVEDVTFLPSGGMIATAGGNVVKIWDVVGGGKCVYSMETHNKTVTSLCVGKVGRDSGEESNQYRLMSVSLDGYLKVFDYSKMKITFSMRFPAPLVSVGFSPDSSTRAIGTSNGIIYMSKRKKEKVEEEQKDGDFLGFFYREEPRKRVLKPSFFRYFHRGQSEKPKGGEHLISRPKRVKLAEHDKLLKKFRHKDALVAVLQKKNPDNSVAVIEELVARKKLFRCVSNLDVQELEQLLVFLQKYTTLPRYAGLLMPFANKVIQMRAEDIRASDVLKVQMRNLKRTIQEELRIQQSLLELQGVISPLMRIAGRN